MLWSRNLTLKKEALSVSEAAIPASNSLQMIHFSLIPEFIKSPHACSQQLQAKLAKSKYKHFMFCCLWWININSLLILSTLTFLLPINQALKKSLYAYQYKKCAVYCLKIWTPVLSSTRRLKSLWRYCTNIQLSSLKLEAFLLYLHDQQDKSPMGHCNSLNLCHAHKWKNTTPCNLANWCKECNGNLLIQHDDIAVEHEMSGGMYWKSVEEIWWFQNIFQIKISTLRQ